MVSSPMDTLTSKSDLGSPWDDDEKNESIIPIDTSSGDVAGVDSKVHHENLQPSLSNSAAHPHDWPT